MSSVKSKLIKLGNTNPELREHLRPIIKAYEEEEHEDDKFDRRMKDLEREFRKRKDWTRLDEIPYLLDALKFEKSHAKELYRNWVLQDRWIGQQFPWLTQWFEDL